MFLIDKRDIFIEQRISCCAKRISDRIGTIGMIAISVRRLIYFSLPSYTDSAAPGQWRQQQKKQ